MNSAVRVTDEGAVRRLTLCRPDEYNTITPALRDELQRALDAAYRYASQRWHCRDACPMRRRPPALPGAVRVLVEALHDGLNGHRRRAAL